LVHRSPRLPAAFPSSFATFFVFLQNKSRTPASVAAPKVVRRRGFAAQRRESRQDLPFLSFSVYESLFPDQNMSLPKSTAFFSSLPARDSPCDLFVLSKWTPHHFIAPRLRAGNRSEFPRRKTAFIRISSLLLAPLSLRSSNFFSRTIP